ncbi:hypothetical protein [Legionella erythra]|uniref:LvrD n=1 Tax=Legionella erythra TaxID=448 RepID=A0A0W0TS16_LEGER|nr:hypothetical protein [Legionella erythra]KTC98219.1 LvrD [Legionella erythra]HEM0351349.1 hypothetical protein [Legionella pneumophila]
MKQFAFLLCLVGFLTACHDNPLKRMPKHEQIKSLLTASRAAEKAMQVFHSPGGGFYLSCMGSNDQHALSCDTFFNEMLHAARQLPQLKGVTLMQLTDPTLFAEIAIDYQNVFFNSLEG